MIQVIGGDQFIEHVQIAFVDLFIKPADKSFVGVRGQVFLPSCLWMARKAGAS